MDPVEGGQVEVGVEVSAEARRVRVSFFDGFSDPGGEATVDTAGAESLTIPVDVTMTASTFDYFLGVTLCDADNLDCTESQNPTSVTYSRSGPTAQAGEPYFVRVTENGIQIVDDSTFSCFNLVAIQIESAM
jgi:hypothetical protein